MHSTIKQSSSHWMTEVGVAPADASWYATAVHSPAHRNPEDQQRVHDIAEQAYQGLLATIQTPVRLSALQ